MGRSYDITPVAFAPGSAKTILEVIAGSLRGFRVKRLWVTSNDVAGATVVRVQVKRLTAAGTSTATTPSPKHLGDLAFTGTAGYNHTVEPTETAVLWQEQFNLLTGWILPLPPGEEWHVPATNANGISVELLDNPGATITVGATIEED